jgi:hypothetical protein
MRSGRVGSEAACVLAALATVLAAPNARAQACCAGGSAITPARLTMHDDALVGVQARASRVLGSYDVAGRYSPEAGGASELDLEQDLFAALRFVRRAQAALLVPLVETRRATPGRQQLGGGVGDVNLSARYDFVDAGESRYVPGVALLGGVTLPTGRATEDAAPPLQADATGIGAYQLNAALALEQIYGPWLVNATAIVAKRTAHAGETLGTQVTLLAAGAYTFDDDSAIALSMSYAFEGDATCSEGSVLCPPGGGGGADVADSGKAVTTFTLSGLWPLSDTWRVLAGISLTPPLDGLGHNQPATDGVSLTVIRSWM